MDALLSLVERLFFADFTTTPARQESRTKSQVEAAGDRQTNDARGKSLEFEEFWVQWRGRQHSLTHVSHRRGNRKEVAWAVTGGRQHGVLG